MLGSLCVLRWGQSHSAQVTALTFAVRSEGLTVTAAHSVAGATQCWSNALLLQAQEVHRRIFFRTKKNWPTSRPGFLPLFIPGQVSPAPWRGGRVWGCCLLAQEPPATFRSGKAPASPQFSFSFFFFLPFSWKKELFVPRAVSFEDADVGWQVSRPLNYSSLPVPIQ